MVKETKQTDKRELRFEKTPYYYKVTVDNKTWYWNRDTGAFDGISSQVAD